VGDGHPSGKVLGRDAAVIPRAEERSYLAQLVAGMLGDEARNPREAEYLALIDRALKDRESPMTKRSYWWTWRSHAWNGVTGCPANGFSTARPTSG
jgi:hypothetical protein